MITFLTIVHIAVCLFLILVVLLQAGKGGGMGIAFGGGGSQTVFGSSGAGNFLTRLTSITAVDLFAHLSRTRALLEPAGFEAPAAPGREEGDRQEGRRGPRRQAED